MSITLSNVGDAIREGDAEQRRTRARFLANLPAVLRILTSTKPLAAKDVAAAKAYFIDRDLTSADLPLDDGVARALSDNAPRRWRQRSRELAAAARSVTPAIASAARRRWTDAHAVITVFSNSLNDHDRATITKTIEKSLATWKLPARPSRPPLVRATVPNTSQQVPNWPQHALIAQALDAADVETARVLEMLLSMRSPLAARAGRAVAARVNVGVATRRRGTQLVLELSVYVDPDVDPSQQIELVRTALRTYVKDGPTADELLAAQRAAIGGTNVLSLEPAVVRTLNALASTTRDSATKLLQKHVDPDAMLVLVPAP